MKTKEQIYNILKAEFYGKENAASAEFVADYCGISKRKLRYICREINNDPDLGFVSTSESIYACKTEEEVEKAISATWKPAITWIKKAQAMSSKRGKQGQYEFTENGKKIKIYFED